MIPNIDHSASSAPAASPSDWARGLVSRYGKYVRKLLWGGLLILWGAVGGWAVELQKNVKASMDDIGYSDRMYEELTAEILESREWIIKGIEFMTTQDLQRKHGLISNKLINDTVAEAKLKEAFILKTWKFDTVSTSVKPEAFSYPLKLSNERRLLLPELYRNIFDLFFLRNPSMDKNTLEASMDKGKYISVGLWTDGKRYFIQKMDIRDEEPEEAKDTPASTEEAPKK